MCTLTLIGVIVIMVFLISLVLFITSKSHSDQENISSMLLIISSFAIVITGLISVTKTNYSMVREHLTPIVQRVENTHTILTFPVKETYLTLVSDEARVYNAIDIKIRVTRNLNYWGGEMVDTYDIITTTVSEDGK